MARLLTLKAAWMMDVAGNKVASTEIAMIKVVAPSMACQVIDWAMQVHGGGGMCDDFPLAYGYAHGARTLRLPTAPTKCTATRSPSGSWASTAPTALQAVGVDGIGLFLQRFFQGAVHHEHRGVFIDAQLGAGAKFFAPDEISRRPAQLHAPGLAADLARQGKALARIHACETEALCSSPLGHLRARHLRAGRKALLGVL
jgi:hypothetical protein